MKVRSDFVSNSSSCSFVIVLNQEYSTHRFIKDLAKACSNPKAEYHNKDIVKRNQHILDFCLNTYELAFLGTWKLRTDEYVNSLEDFKRMYVDDDMDEDEKAALAKEAEISWQHEVARIEKQNSRDYIDNDEKIHAFNDVYASGCAVDSDTMRYEFQRYGYGSDEDADTVKFRIKQLKKLAEESAAYDAGKLVSCRRARCYAITMNTIKNTRNLLDAGVKLVFDKHEDLDKIEKQLEEGKKLFAICIGHDGEGFNSYEIYCEAMAKGLDHLPVEILGAD